MSRILLSCITHFTAISDTCDVTIICVTLCVRCSALAAAPHPTTLSSLPSSLCCLSPRPVCCRWESRTATQCCLSVLPRLSVNSTSTFPSSPLCLPCCRPVGCLHRPLAVTCADLLSDSADCISPPVSTTVRRPLGLAGLLRWPPVSRRSSTRRSPDVVVYHGWAIQR